MNTPLTPEQLTAYLLGEGSAEERAHIEAQMQHDPAARAQSEEYAAFCDVLRNHFEREQDDALTPDQRASLEALPLITVPAPKRPAIIVPSKSPVMGHVLRLAACAVLIGGVMHFMNGPAKQTPVVAASTVEEPLRVKLQPTLDHMDKAAVIGESKHAETSPLSPKDPTKRTIATASTAAISLPKTPPDIIDMPTAKRLASPVTPGTGGGFGGSTLVLAGRSKEALKARLSELRASRDAYFGRSSNERYASLPESAFLAPADAPLSTFSIDVDTASYANVRRFLNDNQTPPADAVRLEELINYFPYRYDAPAADSKQPFSVCVDVAEAPWAPHHRLARIGIKGREITGERGAANFVFLVDVSGSMQSHDKLPLVQRSLGMLCDQLRDDDRVAIVTYAGSTEVKLASTAGKDRAAIRAVIDHLTSGGGTNGAGGIHLAYGEAQKHFLKEGINRVIFCTDGDFNVGVSSEAELEELITAKAKSGVFLSVLGFGTGNLQDSKMEVIADKGNGNYAYIDSPAEARKVLVQQMTGTLITIAKDVKIQVEFNPAQVRSYRLLGYENRTLAAQDFNNDQKDAGEIGAGHTVTALYEIVPTDAPEEREIPLVDELRYQQPAAKSKEPPTMAARPPQPKLEGINDELMTVKLRYKEPDGEISKLMEQPVRDSRALMNAAPQDFKFASAVAAFGMKLRQSHHAQDMSWDRIRTLAQQGKGEDKDGHRGEFLSLIDKAAGR
jgi:secreted protein with Ig-like and vWFA domain